MLHFPDFISIQSELSRNPNAFNQKALEVFWYQAENNVVYSNYIDKLGVNARTIGHFTDIPFLPIQLFKTQVVTCFESVWAQRVYTSSATTGSVQSRHFVKHYADYEASFLSAFKQFYGDVTNYCVLALLPAYLERDGSSLVEMAQVLITQSNHPKSGFYLNNLDELTTVLQLLSTQNKKVLLLGVTFALLDLAEKGPFNFGNLTVMETGGMKGRRKELIREELHQILQQSFGVNAIHSEYGMTELLSQAYSTGNGLFNCPPWMKVLTRDTNDPLQLTHSPTTGGLNVIDLANINSCSFIATQDLGKVYADGSFEVLGRFDNSDVRGCNLMVQ